MIIHCLKCGTGYRFDEGLIEGEGIWVRCSRCRNVFFQTETMVGEDMSAVAGQVGGGQEVGDVGRLEWERGDENLPGLDLGREAPEGDADDLARGVEIRIAATTDGGEEATDGELQGMEINGRDEQGGESSSFGEPGPVKGKREGGFGRALAYFAFVITVITVLGLAFYLLFPGESREAIQTVAERVPIVGQWLGVESDQNQIILAGKLTDVKQRFVHNVILGSLRVVEGTATNTASHPLARLRVKGEIYDARSVLLGERVAYCGNIMSDEELMNATEEDLGKKINRPEGNGFINDRVGSGEQIPFMLIFARENGDVAKTLVRFAGAERLRK